MSARSDSDRFRFLEEHQLSITWYDGGPSITWREKYPEPGSAAGYRPIARAKTLTEAVDIAITRWEKKHGKPWP